MGLCQLQTTAKWELNIQQLQAKSGEMYFYSTNSQNSVKRLHMSTVDKDW